jgi:CHAT domain-containing protein
MAQKFHSSPPIGFSASCVLAMVTWAIAFPSSLNAARGLPGQDPAPPAVSTAAANQAEGTALELGKIIERELAAGERHAYLITVAAGQVMRLEIKDHGTDVGVVLTSPNGESISPWLPVGERFDIKPVTSVASTSGVFRVEVYASAKARAGRYEIRLAELRPANDDDRALQEARNLMTIYHRLRRQGHWAEAGPYIKRIVEIRERVLGQDNLLFATTLGFLSSYYDNIGDYANAESASLRAVKIKEKLLGPDHPDVAYDLHGLSVTYRYRGEDDKAEAMEQRALAILVKAHQGESAAAAGALEGLGSIYYARGDYRQAEEYAQRARAIWEKLLGANLYHIAPSFSFLGRVAYDQGDYSKAEELFQRALTLSENGLGTDNLNVTRYRNDLAMLYCTEGNYAKGEAVYGQALALHRQKGAMSDRAVQDTLFGLARCYAAQGNAPEALKLQSEAGEIEERFLAVNLASGSEREKEALLENLSSRSWRNISLHVQLAPDDATARNLAVTTVLRSKGRVQDAMSAGLSALRQRFGNDDQKILDQLNDATSRLASLVLGGPQKSPAAEYEQKIKALEEQRESLEDDVNRRSAGFYRASRPVTLAAVQAVIPADAALVEFAVYHPFDPRSANEKKSYGKPRYVVYVIRSQGAVQWSELGDAGIVDRAIGSLRRALRDPQRKDVRRLARALDKLVMQPVRSLAGDATHLLISPDGELNLVPFEALVDERGNYQTQNYSISYLTAGRDLLRMQVKRGSKSGPVVFADPLYGEPGAAPVAAGAPARLKLAAAAGQRTATIAEDLNEVYFAPLRGTEQEAHVIRTLFPDAQVFTGAQATKSALNRVVAPRILHIATHGFFLEDPAAGGESPDSTTPQTASRRKARIKLRIENPLLRSGLALSGANLSKGGGEGILTALEASNLNLWGTKLVTLSACETGVGEVKDGEGVYGLRRSFFLAGSEALVMSLWSVSDQVTREMMTAYYTGLKQGLGRGEALHQAQLAMLKRKGREHPFYWASFIQSGDWTSFSERPAK